ncbi:hypothetical protein SAMN04488107_0608 [Geodermatophilus saharensis]|uniref:DUF1579 domain-containing protein n=1 Tax=Geodermatophilus saharensis TaxID=1137994 RepID=A0A239A8S1_9ACTN|nr:hypothetical protein [Geodermatophilus saharensis]SNR91454.1 hypothetical protein SAMN04488107_0608 [Geodermatophilus saharensis]
MGTETVDIETVDIETVDTETVDTWEALDARAVALRSLDRLVGTWTVSGPGGHGGEVRCEWADGGCWLVQHVDLHRGDAHDRGVGYVGYDADDGELRSHFFGARGELLELTYRIEGDLLVVRSGGTGSRARFEGRFSADGTVNDGVWRWPGGGHATTLTRTA